jgi:methylmalonyl-CoA/ethylmalonyl-CoA epimerase
MNGAEDTMDLPPGSTWRVVGLHHVAFAHGADPTSDDALCRFIGTEPQHVEAAAGFIERMYAVGDAYIQTLEATGEGVVQRFLDKRGPGLHHVAFAVDRIDAALADLRGRGIRLVDERPRAGGMGTRIAFVDPSGFGGLLVELVEQPDTPEPVGSIH